jgi:hypothetical protein
MTPSKEHWQVNTERIARLILDAAAKSHSEEDLKMAVEPVLQSAMKQMGIDVSMVRYEKTTSPLCDWGITRTNQRLAGCLASSSSCPGTRRCTTDSIHDAAMPKGATDD